MCCLYSIQALGLKEMVRFFLIFILLGIEKILKLQETRNMFTFAFKTFSRSTSFQPCQF